MEKHAGKPRPVKMAELPGTETFQDRYARIRQQTLNLCEGLEAEDFQLQAAPFVSPLKWHLAHVTWFFETFVLKPFASSYRVFHPQFEMLFNSYYQGVGKPFSRPLRGILSRPTLAEVYRYRRHVDDAMDALLASEGRGEAIAERTLLGLNHEQQHQELMLMDLKYNFFQNPILPVYRPAPVQHLQATAPMGWTQVKGGLISVGHAGTEFSFDNEMPAHQVFLEDYRLANRLVSNGEYAEFIADGGYLTPALWLSDGWDWVQQHQMEHPLYWRKLGGEWQEFSLHGEAPLCTAAPVCHISFYEAQAYATWKGCRLPTEQEWEWAGRDTSNGAHFLEEGLFRPQSPTEDSGLQQMWGTLWEWTQSPYMPYPGYRPTEGALGEYNGKFMCGQMVLRGGSFATPFSHFRPSYRNFFYPADRWPFCGIRLADSC